MPSNEPRVALKPLNITCGSTDCENGLHCFRRAKRLNSNNIAGACRVCGADLVDWNRVHKHDLADASYIFVALQNELIRHHFFHVEMDQRAINYARRKGRLRLREAVEQRIRNSVGSATPFRDGTQTPMKGNPIFYAQHATASCCRRCIEEWHAIQPGRNLMESEVTYLTDLAMLYLNQRLPQLTDLGERVPPIRRR
jgi:hypothetical protein